MKVYDAFTFYNELDLLEIRLNVLDDVVDRFVLVEATRTFQNREKPLFFERNKERFEAYLHKIVHVVVDDMPNSENPHLLEAHQRNAISRGLIHCSNRDQIVLSDLDEIPNPRVLVEAAQRDGIRMFRQALYYYYLNTACMELPDLPWSAMASRDAFLGPQALRDCLVKVQGELLSGLEIRDDVELVEDGGWHFSYLGGADAIIRKVQSFAHTEYNNSTYLDRKRIEKIISDGGDIFGRELHFARVPLDDSFPKYIRDNRARYAHLIQDETLSRSCSTK